MPIVTIGINRPEKRNSVDTETSEALKIAFQVSHKNVLQAIKISSPFLKEFEQDPDLHCAVLHGLGGNFCAGYDLEVHFTVKN